MILGGAALWPFLYGGFIVTSWFYVKLLERVEAFSEIDYWWLKLDSYLRPFTGWWCVGLFAVYVVLLFRNGHIGSRRRVRWLAAFLLAGPLAFPIYWYCHIWRESQGV